MLNFDFLKDRYDFELRRNDQLNSSLPLPVGVLTALGGLIAVMARSFSYRSPTLAAIFIAFLAADVLVFFVCLVFLSFAYHRHSYVYLPLLQELEDANLKWREVSAQTHVDGLDEAFILNLRALIIQAADWNTRNNDARIRHLYWARIALFSVLVLTALAGLPYVADQTRFVMSSDQVPKPTQTQPTSVPKLPPFPANRIIKDGSSPKRMTPVKTAKT